MDRIGGGAIADTLRAAKTAEGNPEEELDDALKETEGDLSDYAKAIEKAGLSTAEENTLIEQYAASLGLADTTALLAANDQELLNAAWEAGAISLDKFTQISLEAATGTGELSDATVQYLEDALAAAGGTEKLATAISGAANATTVLRDQLGAVFSKAMEKKWEGPRERVKETIDFLIGQLTAETDPGKIDAIWKALEKLGTTYGFVTAQGLALEQLKIDWQLLLPELIFEGNDPVKLQTFFEELKRSIVPGEKIDLYQELKDAGFIPDDSLIAKIKDAWSTAFTDISSGLSTAFPGVWAGVQAAQADQVTLFYGAYAADCRPRHRYWRDQL